MRPHEALTMILDWGFTKEQYQKLRTNAIKRNADIYPPYDQVKDAKLDCQPQNIQCSPTECVVPMQDVLNHQVVISSQLVLLLLLECIIFFC